MRVVLQSKHAPLPQAEPMRAAAIAAAVITAFLGVMYVRFSGDAVPPAEPAPSPAFGSSRVVARARRITIA
ncbi:MAG TPA: hypothetical protein VGR43_08225 [Dehalococcoidia bacterium]|nr:hypothetical protein [Dehalococcoidia bacterium]